jgi:RecB family exonuclease
MITSTSYSKLLDFEACKYRAKLKHIDRVPEVKSPAADRGTAIHQMAEDFVRSKITTLPVELKHFRAELEAMQRRFKAGEVSLEGEWGFDKNWAPAAWKTAWLRMKADAVIFLSKSNGVVVDYKTGRRFGNEIKHGEQVQLYAIATFILYPKLDTIDVELWYIDLDDMITQTYRRADALRYVQPFEKRLMKMCTATEFPPNPNIYTCKWCPYNPAKGGQCIYGVVDGENPMKLYRSKFG